MARKAKEAGNAGRKGGVVMVIQFFLIVLDYLWHFAQTLMVFGVVACLVAPITFGVYCFDHRHDD